MNKANYFIIYFSLTILFINEVSSQPSVITLPASSITQTSVVLGADIKSNGNQTLAVFWIGRTKIPEFIPNDYNGNIDFKNVFDTIITLRIDGLMPNTTYRYRVDALFTYSDSSRKWREGREEYFTTLADKNSGGFIIPIKFSNQGQLNKIKFLGLHTHASDCFDWSFGEFQLPPLPPDDFNDIRFVSPRKNLNHCYDLGIKMDIRKYRDSTQIDTFKIRFQTIAEYHPLILSWPNLNNYYSGSVTLKDPHGGIYINTDMKTQTSDTIDLSYESNFLYIITEHPKRFLSMEIEQIGNQNLLLSARFNPAGDSTFGWFEWGKTNEFDNQTSMKYLGDGYSQVEFNDLLESLPSNSPYYFRTVTQNKLGKFYSVEQIYEVRSSINIIKEKPNHAERFELLTSYPNPFNTSTIISFRIPYNLSNSHAELTIYNIQGQLVKTLLREVLPAGNYMTQWDGTDTHGKIMSSSMYFYQLKLGTQILIGKVSLIK